MASIHDYKDKLFASSLFQWMPEEGLDNFEGCFDLESEELLCSETRWTENRIGYLLSGNAILEREGQFPAIISEGHLFGVSLSSRADISYEAENAAISAISNCTVLWMDYEKSRFVCYGGCWFHARLLLEIKEHLKNQK